MANNNLYIMFDDNNKFAGFGIQVSEKIPGNAVLITTDEQQQYADALDSGIKEIILDSGKIRVIDKYSEIELLELKAQQKKAALIVEASRLLKDNEFRWTNPIKWAEYNDAKRATVTAYYKALVAVINNESETIPILENIE